MLFWKGKRVLVTGGSGFIGSHLVELLIAQGARVTTTAFSSATEFRFLDGVKSGIRTIVGNLANPDVAHRAVANQDVVFHLAARVRGIEYNLKHPGSIFRDNMMVYMSVLDAARVACVGLFVVTSSACVYPRYCTIPTPENESFKDRPEPTNEGYGWAKRMEEFMGEAYAREFGMNIRIARPYNCYGPRDNFDPASSHVIPALIHRIFSGENPLIVWGDGSASRSFLYVTDFVRGLMAVAERSPQVEAINIGANEETTIRNLTETIVCLSGVSTRIVFDPSKPSGQPRRCCDTHLAERLLGFRAEVPLKDGLARTIAWYRANIIRSQGMNRGVMDSQERMFGRTPVEYPVAKPDTSENNICQLWADETLFCREVSGREPSELDFYQREQRHRGRLTELRLLIHRYLREYLAESHRPVDIQQLELVRPSYNEEELLAAVDVLLEDRLTMGPRVATFEKTWSDYLPSSFAIFVNSGSSANLLAFSALSFPSVENHLKPGDEVIVPALAWSTSLFPIVQIGCIPVLVDVDLDTLNMDPDQVAEAISPRTRALMAVHLLGNPCDMISLMKIARLHKLWVVEDCCESHGASINGQKVGTFGDLSTFSLYFSHHITTIEGGLICGLDREKWHDLLISMRAHGWIRGRSDHDDWVRRHPDIDPRWLFVTTGYNLRPTEINAAFGLVQLSKLPGFITQRCVTRRSLMNRLRAYEDYLIFQKELPGNLHTAFGFSFIVRQDAPFTRNEFQSNLESCRIQTRPIIGSNLARQPVMRHIPHRIHGNLQNTDLAHYNGMMIVNHHSVTVSQQDYLVECVEKFIKQRT